MPRRILIVIACGAALAAALYPAGSTVTVAPAGNPAAPQAGYRVYIDPATGGLTAEAPTADTPALDKDIQDALSTSSAGLREEPSPVPGGGIVVDLQGRFHNAAVATIDASGRLEAPCVSGLPHDDSEEGGHE